MMKTVDEVTEYLKEQEKEAVECVEQMAVKIASTYDKVGLAQLSLGLRDATTGLLIVREILQKVTVTSEIVRGSGERGSIEMI